MIWKEEYELGVYEIDNQHKKLVEVINNFKNSIPDSTTDSRAEMGNVLAYLMNYTKFHFEAEEQIMEKINYPDLVNHRIKHKNLISKIMAVLIKIKNKESYTPIEFYYFLMSWLNDHILHEDSLIKNYVINHDIHLELKKVILNAPESIIRIIEPNLELININLEKGLITPEDERMQRTMYLNNIYSHYSLDNKKSVENIIDSIKMLVSKNMLTAEEYEMLLKQFKIDL